jgi:hypothetical protein
LRFGLDPYLVSIESKHEEGGRRRGIVEIGFGRGSELAPADAQAVTSAECIRGDDERACTPTRGQPSATGESRSLPKRSQSSI